MLHVLPQNTMQSYSRVSTNNTPGLNIFSDSKLFTSPPTINDIGIATILTGEKVNTNLLKPLSEIKVTADSLQQGLKSAKIQERRVVFDTLKNKSVEIKEQRKDNMLQRKDVENLKWTKCIKDIEGQTSFSELRTLTHDLELNSTMQQKIFQHVAKHYAKIHQPIPEDIVGLLSDPKSEILLKVLKNNDNLITILNDCGIVDLNVQKIISNVLMESKTPTENLKKDAEKLLETKKRLEKLINNPIKDENLLSSNLELKNLLRNAFENKAYQFLKECEDNPTIRFLHEINLAMYTDTPLLSAYLSEDANNPGLGNQLYANAKQENNKAEMKNPVDILTKPGSFIDKMRDYAVKKGLYSSHSCLGYIINHFTQFFGAFTSTKLGSYLFDYDPAGKLGNNVGALSTETFNVFGKKAKAIDVRTPSPTIGNKVSPEFRAALQAIENQKIASMYGKPNEEGIKGYGRPNTWIYTNYQEITNLGNGENQRSVAIMKLNDEFPLSFKGITLSKDSDYFLNGLGHGSKMWSKIDERNETFETADINSFIEEMKENFCHKSHFTLENRTHANNKGAGLYFPVSSEGDLREAEINDIKMMIESIADITGQLLHKTLGDKGSVQGRDAWKIKTAAKEFVYAAIQGKMRNKELASQ
ncbi:MAG: hypothetical protein H0W50_06095, partial [Parachlamydiaceae bacterium]|nr:hypothetical protein [Parachlamydiaceae bacterium]